MDETIIRGWWTKWPSANIGIATGEVSNLAVIDLDGPNTQTLLKREGIFLPETATVQTGRGYHAFYAYPQLLSHSESIHLDNTYVKRGGRLFSQIIAPRHWYPVFAIAGLWSLALLQPCDYGAPLKAGSHAWRGEEVGAPNEGTIGHLVFDGLGLQFEPCG